jgi:hypothetical protein
MIRHNMIRHNIAPFRTFSTKSVPVIRTAVVLGKTWRGSFEMLAGMFKFRLEIYSES